MIVLSLSVMSFITHAISRPDCQLLAIPLQDNVAFSSPNNGDGPVAGTAPSFAVRSPYTVVRLPWDFQGRLTYLLDLVVDRMEKPAVLAGRVVYAIQGPQVSGAASLSPAAQHRNTPCSAITFCRICPSWDRSLWPDACCSCLFTSTRAVDRWLTAVGVAVVEQAALRRRFRRSDIPGDPARVFRQQPHVGRPYRFV